MKTRQTQTKVEPERTIKRLKNPRRRQRCGESNSLSLKDARKEPPGDRGACEQETSSQGSE